MSQGLDSVVLPRQDFPMDQVQASSKDQSEASPSSQTVFVSGCFDMLHSGHVAFLQTAASYGKLHVAVGSDATIHGLKGRSTICSEAERLYMIRALGCVSDAFISAGRGVLDFVEDLQRLRPDRFVVNADGHNFQKEQLCKDLGIEYTVLPREPSAGLPGRSTTSLRQIDALPYRIDLAGGWLDQPAVSSMYPGPVLTVSIEPTVNFNHRSGMATSTRNRARELWGPRIPPGDPEHLAKLLFAYDNPPGTSEVSGSQDAIGIVLPGLAYSYYEGDYWPTRIVRNLNDDLLQFLEDTLYLVPLAPREDSYRAVENQNLTVAGVQALSEAAEGCWKAILAQDRKALGQAMRQSFEAQVELFPNMVNPGLTQLIERYRHSAAGWKLSGAGGGGYLILVSDQPIDRAIQVQIRRSDA